MALTAAALRSLRDGKRRLRAITDRLDDDIISAWATTWEGLSDALEAVLQDQAARGVTRTRLFREQKLQEALRQVSQQLAILTGNATVATTLALGATATAAVEAHRKSLSVQLAERRYIMTDPEQIRAIVKRSTGAITKDFARLGPDTQARMRASLLRGFGAGLNPRDAARLMTQQLQGAFNLSRNRALLIARTEHIDAYTRAAEATHRANADVVKGWVWIAELSSRTCISCIDMNGTEHPLEENGPYDHHAGRCTRAPVTKTFRELGIDLPEAPSDVPDSKAWFNALPKDTQKDILGPSRYEAWKRGEFPMGTWSKRIENPGWRPSHVPSPAPKPR